MTVKNQMEERHALRRLACEHLRILSRSDQTISMIATQERVASRRCADTLHLSRASTIRRAVERMNRQTQALVRARRLAKASKKVRKESMRVNRQFAAIEGTPDA